jgi:inorganic pyrophosphatase
MFLEKNGVPVSPFHDIPLFANAEKTILNMVVEIPRWTNAKLEVTIRNYALKKKSLINKY